MKPRVLFYVQHLLGIGHLRRAEILADAMAEAGLEVTVAFGGPRVPEVPFEKVRVAYLPSATIKDEDFSTLVDEDGRAVDETWRERRAGALLDVYRSTAPAVVLIELFPFGRRQFRFELLPLLELIHSRAERPSVACSVRDVLVATKKPGRDAETVATLRRFFDAVLVHGDPQLIPFDATFKAAGEIPDLIHHTGYVTSAGVDTEPAMPNGEVIVSAGGGAVGGPLLAAAARARPQTPLAGNVWRFLTGPNLPEAGFRKLAASVGSGAIVERFRPDFAARLKGAALSVSQAGYNTTMDILAAGVRAVVVPYETTTETEQRLRAEILAHRGLLTIVPESRLSPASLASGIAAALNMPAPRAGINLTGAAASARLIRDLAARQSVDKR